MPVQVNGKVRARIDGRGRRRRGRARGRRARRAPHRANCSTAARCARSSWCPGAWSTSSSADTGRPVRRDSSHRPGLVSGSPHFLRHFLLSPSRHAPGGSPCPDDVPLPPPPSHRRADAVPSRDRLRALRHDPRVGGRRAASPIACVAGVFWFRAGDRARRRRRARPRPQRRRAREHDRAVGDHDHDQHDPPRHRSSCTSPVRSRSRVSSRCPPGSRVVDAIAAAGGANARRRPRPAEPRRAAWPTANASRSRCGANRRRRSTPARQRWRRGARRRHASARRPGRSTSTPPARPSSSRSPASGRRSRPRSSPSANAPAASASVDDLRRVRGIGDARFAQIEPLVTV